MGKGDIISNQGEVIKAEFWGDGKILGEDRSFRLAERLRGEVNNRKI